MAHFRGHRNAAQYNSVGDYLTNGGNLAANTLVEIYSSVTGELAFAGVHDGTPGNLFVDRYVPSSAVDIGDGLTLDTGVAGMFSRDGSDNLVVSLDATNTSFRLDLDWLDFWFPLQVIAVATVTTAGDANLDTGARFYVELRNATSGDYFQQRLEYDGANWDEGYDYDIGGSTATETIAAANEGPPAHLWILCRPLSGAAQVTVGGVQPDGSVSATGNGDASGAFFDGTDSADTATVHVGGQTATTPNGSDALTVTIHGFIATRAQGSVG